MSFLGICITLNKSDCPYAQNGGLKVEIQFNNHSFSTHMGRSVLSVMVCKDASPVRA